MSEETNEKVVSIGQSRDMDLYIGAAVANVDGVEKKVAIFSARVKSPAFFGAILQNLQDMGDNSFVVSISQDAKALERAISEKVVQLGEFVPTYTVNVETLSKERIEIFDSKFNDNPENAPKVDVPTYNFHSGGFPDTHVEDFVDTMKVNGSWLLVIEPMDNPGERKMWENGASRIAPLHTNPKGNRSTRRKAK
jgi:hypothetical protein